MPKNSNPPKTVSNPLKTVSLQSLLQEDAFVARHIGPSETQIRQMLETLGLASLSCLVEETVPDNIRRQDQMQLGTPQSETSALQKLRNYANQNQLFKSYIGMGYYNTITPAVIQRNVLENPGWYTAYTPYQPEIAQGRLEGLLNFQQLVMDLTAMELANASLLDEGTAAAEAMALCKRAVKKNKSNCFFIANDCHCQTIAVVKTRASHYGFDVLVGDPETDLQNGDYFGALLQYPGTYGHVRDIREIIELAHQQNTLVTVATDLMSLVLLTPPGELGADVVVGNSQRFGVPMGYGGPHAAFFACRDKFKRSMPGRIIGVSIDKAGKPALRMALQTREQHIRREKANSNICTSQSLLAIMASFYAVYHGPVGLQTIAQRIHRLSGILACGLKQLGYTRTNTYFFDTLTIDVGERQSSIVEKAVSKRINLRKIGDQQLGVSIDETTSSADILDLLGIFGESLDSQQGSSSELGTFEMNSLDVNHFELNMEKMDSAFTSGIPPQLQRQSNFMTHDVFNRYHSETDMMRYMRRLENKDLALNYSMIALGSCTMKLNAAAEMMPISWPEFTNIHPFVPTPQVPGYTAMIKELEQMLAATTGYDAVSMQPNAGSQGEYAGLLTIKKYHESRGDSHRDVCLIPSSAHGTNPASAAMASLKVVIVHCDQNGNVDIDDLRDKATQHQDTLAALMVTYPSTHGVFETGITEICNIIHEHGGQVYMDGANMNALVGLAAPGQFGSDVSHLNLHKTFAIPHGGGGPGMGPIAVNSHLAPFLPGHPVIPTAGLNEETNVVAAAPWGSAGILPISWMYVTMMGATGLTRATKVAILNANYMAQRLTKYYPVLYVGQNGRVAHECIIDLRPTKEATDISEEDIAKRLMDYGFHAPTMSFPVSGTLMIEPTESESLFELDRFIDAMIQIKEEINKVESGEYDRADNPLKNAPHTINDINQSQWNHCYSKDVAVFPLPYLREEKYWPPVNRIDNVYGDRNLFCACPLVESYE